MNICFVLDEYDNGGGIGVSARCLSKELTLRGHKVVIITSKPKNVPIYEKRRNIKIYRTTSLCLPFLKVYFSIASKKTIKNILVENNIDIVHFHTLTYLTKNAYYASKDLTLKKVYTYHILPEHYTMNSVFGLFAKKVITSSLEKLCRRCDLVTVPSRNLLIRVKRMNSNTQYLSNAFDLTERPYKNDNKKTKEFTVLYVGRLYKEKNVSLLIKAFAAFNNTYKNSKLIIIGEGYLKKELIQLSNELNKSKDILFLGQINHEEIGKYYVSCDVFVLPSLLETQGIVAIEAMSFSKPIIVTNKIVSANELVHQGKNGYIIEPTVESLTQALTKLYENPQLAHKMGLYSKKLSKQFSSEEIVTKLEKLYRELLQDTI